MLCCREGEVVMEFATCSLRESCCTSVCVCVKSCIRHYSTVITSRICCCTSRYSREIS